MAATKAVPYCEIAKLNPSPDGLVLNYGFAFNERPVEQIHHPEYTFNNFIPEYNTNTIMTKPILIRKYSPGDQAWTVNKGDYWQSDWALHPMVHVMFWTLTEIAPSGASNHPAQYKITSPNELLKNEAFAIEYNKLLSNRQLEDYSYITMGFGNGKYRIRITKHDFTLDIKHGEEWVAHNLPMGEKFNFSKMVSSQYLFVIPYFDGILISNDMVDYFFIKEDEPLTVDAGHVVIEGNCGVSYYALHKIRFANASMTSADFHSYIEQDPANANIKVGVIPQGTTVTKTVNVAANNKDISYTIGVDAYTHPVGIAGVSVYFNPVISRAELTPSVVPEVISFEESTGWSADELNARIVIDNGYPHPYRGAYRKYDKLQAWIGWQMTEVSNGEVVNTFTDGFLRNVYTVKEVIDETTQSDSTITLVCGSYLQNVIDGTNIVTPDYNGWSIPEVLKDILNRAGIPDDRISIANDWDSETFEETEENDTWQPEQGESLWDSLKKIVEELLGGWIIQYPDGKIRIEPYPEIEDINWQEEEPNIIFNVDTDILNISFKDADDGNFYNAVSVYGKTKNDVAIGSILIDNDSLYNPESDKFIGYLKHWVIIDGIYNTQEICDEVCRRLFAKVNKFTNKIIFTTNVKKGSERLYQGNTVVLEYGDGTRIGVLTRGVSSTVAHNHFQQTIEGEYVIIPEPEPEPEG